VYAMTVSKSGYVCEYIGCVNLGQDRGVSVMAGCISIRTKV
jgi:hypothetical protein